MSKLPTAPLSETVTFGSDLSERQTAFVREFLERGSRPGAAADAAVAAGYARAGPEGRAAARVRASELLRNDKVLRYLRDELARKLSAGAALGVATLIDLAQNAQSENVRLSAARELVDRGYGPVMSRNATITAKVGIEDFLAQIEAREKAQSATILEGKAIAAGDDGFGEPDTPSTGS